MTWSTDLVRWRQLTGSLLLLLAKLIEMDSILLLLLAWMQEHMRILTWRQRSLIRISTLDLLQQVLNAERTHILGRLAKYIVNLLWDILVERVGLLVVTVAIWMHVVRVMVLARIRIEEARSRSSLGTLVLVFFVVVLPTIAAIFVVVKHVVQVVLVVLRQLFERFVLGASGRSRSEASVLDCLVWRHWTG